MISLNYINPNNAHILAHARNGVQKQELSGIFPMVSAP